VRSRRAFLAGTAALTLAPSFVRGQSTRTVTDDTGRRAEVPLKVDRVYAAGPPASILVFAVAPEKLVGWTTPFRPDERPFVPAKYADLPTLGRLTGRGNTANVEVVLAAKPDLIVDYGSVGPTYTSLADRVQTQTGIPYLLLDGAFDRMPQSLRRLGEIVGEPARGEEWAPGFCHFPMYGKEYFESLTSEHLVTRTINGRRFSRFEPTRERNEALDCRVYARAAALSLRVDGWAKSKWDDLEDQMTVSPVVGPAAAPRATVARPATPVPQFKPVRANNDWMD